MCEVSWPHIDMSNQCLHCTIYVNGCGSSWSYILHILSYLLHQVLCRFDIHLMPISIAISTVIIAYVGACLSFSFAAYCQRIIDIDIDVTV